ncbi:MAG: PQQ-dependent sugar dehydrogenase [Aestuariibacter sp.]
MRIFFIIVGLFIAQASVFAQPKFVLDELTDALQKPWAMAFLDDERILITEKSGQLRLFTKGELSAPIAGVPAVYFAGQGGLLDIAIVENQSDLRVLMSFAAGNERQNALRVVAATLETSAELRLTDLATILTVTPEKDTPVHYGGRLALMPDGTLLVTSGDGFDFRESAQKEQSLLGKIVRVNIDGSVPDDNPFVSDKNYHPAIFSLGHRNPQALFYDASRNWIVSHEHGPAGGDEINIIEAGKNYGWPVITNGKDYSGANISPFTEYPGMEQPFVDWTPSIAPSDMIVYQGSVFPQLKGDFLVTTLKTQALLWVDMDDNNVVAQTNLLPKYAARYRAIEESPKGEIYLLTDDGRLMRLSKE